GPGIDWMWDHRVDSRATRPGGSGAHCRARNEVGMSTMIESSRRRGWLLVASLLLGLPMFAAAPVAAQTSDEPIDIELSSSSAVPGDSIEVGISLHTKSHTVGGIQIDIQADPPLTIGITDAGRPDCWRNTDLNKDYTIYAFPDRANDRWDYMRALVLSLT